jgi:hypothetical protein
MRWPKRRSIRKTRSRRPPRRSPRARREGTQARIEAAAEARRIQSQIQQLNKEREAFVAAEMKKQAENGGKTLDQALVETTRSQATALGYEFEN